jgi:hypothetical protein
MAREKRFNDFTFVEPTSYLNEMHLGHVSFATSILILVRYKRFMYISGF